MRREPSETISRNGISAAHRHAQAAVIGARAEAIEAEPKTTAAGSNAPISGPQSPLAARPDAGRFTQGSTMRHVLVMSLTSGVGLIAIFFVDFLSLMYVAWLGSTEKTAAINFASIVLFFLIPRISR